MERGRARGERRKNTQGGKRAGLRTREPSIMHSPRRRCVGKINWNGKWWNGGKNGRREGGEKNDRPSADKGGEGRRRFREFV